MILLIAAIATVYLTMLSSLSGSLYGEIYRFTFTFYFTTTDNVAQHCQVIFTTAARSPAVIIMSRSPSVCLVTMNIAYCQTPYNIARLILMPPIDPLAKFHTIFLAAFVCMTKIDDLRRQPQKWKCSDGTRFTTEMADHSF